MLKTLAGAGLVTMNPYKGAAVRVVDDELRDQTALVSVAAWRHEPDWLRHGLHGATPSWKREAAEHLAVLQAAEDGDAERAATLLRRHITAFVARNFPPSQESQTSWGMR
jgi:DNA-binding GntR family transcriptional regulator